MCLFVCLVVCLFVCDGHLLYFWQVMQRKLWYAKAPDMVLVCLSAGDCTMLPVHNSWSNIWESSAREARTKILVYNIYIYIYIEYSPNSLSAVGVLAVFRAPVEGAVDVCLHF